MNQLIVLIGLPASGKSTMAKKYKEIGYKVHSSDALREELFGDVYDQSKNELLFRALHERIAIDLELGNNVVYDATNLSQKRRRGYLQSINKIDCKKIAVVIATPYNECIRRDRERERKVGKDVLDRMYKSFNFPMLQEGFDRIQINYGADSRSTADLEWYQNKEYNITDHKEFLKTVGQNNSNHTLTIGDHCQKVFSHLVKLPLNVSPLEMHYAGLLHDFGKLKTMSFTNSKGEYSNQAHYYSHENVSAYDTMFYMIDKGIDTAKVCQIINYHMRPHLLKTEKSINKFKRFVGDEFWEMLLLFNKADKEAR